MTTKYFAKEGFPLRQKDANVVGKEFELITEKYGQLSTRTVLAEAKSVRSPLHRFFQWNDTKAGELYRRGQAGRLINCISVVVTYNGKSEEQSAFLGVNKKVKGKDRFVYLSVDKAMTDEDSRKQIVAQAVRELVYWKQKYSYLKELSTVMKAIQSDKTVKKVGFSNKSKAYSSGVYA